MIPQILCDSCKRLFKNNNKKALEEIKCPHCKKSGIFISEGEYLFTYA